MSQSSYRNKVYATFGIVSKSIKSNTARRFGLIFTCYHLYCLFRHFRSEVIKHNTVHTTQVENLLQFIKVSNFNFDFQIFALFFTILFGTGNSFINTSGKIHVIIFQENHVEKSDTMIYTTANLYCHFFEDTHSGSCLTRI